MFGTAKRRAAVLSLGLGVAFGVLFNHADPAGAQVCNPGFTITWVAEGTNNLWENPDNWADAISGAHRVPNADDIVCVEVVGTSFTNVAITGAAKVRSIEAYLYVGSDQVIPQRRKASARTVRAAIR